MEESGKYDPEGDLHFRDGDEMGGMTIEDRTLRLSMMLAERHADDVAVRDAAIQSLGNRIGDIRKSMGAQMSYDFNTVRSLEEVGKMLIENGTFLPEGPGEIKRLMSILRRGIGHACKLSLKSISVLSSKSIPLTDESVIIRNY